MEKKNVGKELLEYNSIIKENDDIYREIAKTLGLPDCAFWILYMLREGGTELTQREICAAIYQPKQTVNSALKKLEQEGYIEMAGQDNHRRKPIHLTEKGEQLAQRTVDRVIAAEQKTLSEMTQEEKDVFIRLFRKYTDLLRKNMREL